MLIVDDDRQVLAALSTLLEPWGLHVTTMADPQQFWQVLETSAPNLLILDIEMPSFSGIELCQVVRNDPRWSELPVLFLSGHNDPEVVYQVFAVGADDYVQKPIEVFFNRKLPRDAGNFRIKPKSSKEPSQRLGKLHDYITGGHLVNPTLFAEAE